MSPGMNQKSLFSLRGRFVAVLLLAFVALAALLVWHSLALRQAHIQAALDRLQYETRLISARQQSLIERGDSVLNALISTPTLRGAGNTPCEQVLAERLQSLSLSMAEAEAPAQRQLLISLAIALSILAGILLFIFWGGERCVMRPLHRLAQAARRFGTGDFTARNDLPCDSIEIGVVAHAFADMAAALQDSTVSRQCLEAEIEVQQQLAKQLRDSKERLRMALKAAKAGCLEWHLDGGQDNWSDEVWALFGLEPTAGPPGYETWRQIVHPDDLERAVRIVNEAVASGSAFEFEWRIKVPDNASRNTAPRWIMSWVQPERDATGRVTRYFSLSMDISERKEAELALAKYRDRLEEKVAERTAELAAANKDLEGFTYAASHDLKGPLGRINNFCTLLSQRYRPQLEGDGLMFLDLIQQNAQRLMILVADLLAHAQIGQQPRSAQLVDVAPIVHTIFHERSDELRQGGVELRLGLPEGFQVPGDPSGLTQALRNLIDNAIKYSARARPPVIDVGGQIADGRYHLWVRDNGIGIEPVYHEKIFDIFRRLHTYTEYPGNGVGLALVRKAVERMGGKIWVDSEIGQGTTFFLEWCYGGRDGTRKGLVSR